MAALGSQGSESIHNVTGSTVGTTVTFTGQPTNFYIRNAGVSDVFISLTSTSVSSTNGHPIETTGNRYFVARDGYFAGLCVVTTAAGSTAPVKIIAWR